MSVSFFKIDRENSIISITFTNAFKSMLILYFMVVLMHIIIIEKFAN